MTEIAEQLIAAHEKDLAARIEVLKLAYSYGSNCTEVLNQTVKAYVSFSKLVGLSESSSPNKIE